MAFPVPCQVCVFLAAAVTSGALRLEDGGTQADCTCLNWKQVYERGLVKCGGGLEHLGLALQPSRSWNPEDGGLFSYECRQEYAAKEGDLPALMEAIHSSGKCGEEKLESMDAEDCNDYLHLPNSSFYPHQDHNMCVKAAPFAYRKSKMLHGLQWCYVSSKCAQLNEGMPVNENVSVKTCQQWGPDKSLADLKVPALCSLQNTMIPSTSFYGGCLLGVYKAYGRGSTTWEQDLELVPGLKDPRLRATYWKELKRDEAVVQQGKSRWRVYWDWRGENCEAGCR
mmetsp:Transcript_90580/g.219747  ORF Transcript_90580/g.219747 Transcript_90580/m.219747 type:complete len:282 (-) Transcript_90580:109-954(-)